LPGEARIARVIEFTRVPSLHETGEEENEEGLLLRAADLVGQLGDPHYLRKANALHYGFEEPADLTRLYPQFYWNSVSAHISAHI
jgi:hypothetical protein